MSVRLQSVLHQHLPALRHEPISKRIRAELDGQTVVDTTHAVLVWEPRRVICEYAVPVDELRAELVEPTGSTAAPEVPAQGPLFPNVPFAAHTADGRSMDVRLGERTLPSAAFLPADPDLDGLAVLDFDAFDRWWQEDEANIGHPRDPFHRIDTFPSSRRVVVTRGSTVVADSTRPTVLFEAGLPPRFYLPREDVQAEIVPTETTTVCPYKGAASYWTVEVGGEQLTDAVWSYLRPLPDSVQIEGRLCFDDGVFTVTVDPG